MILNQMTDKKDEWWVAARLLPTLRFIAIKLRANLLLYNKLTDIGC